MWIRGADTQALPWSCDSNMDWVPIFDVASTDSRLAAIPNYKWGGKFPIGRFGFYGCSQGNEVYGDFVSSCDDPNDCGA